MGLSQETIKKRISLDKVSVLITALEIFANGDPISIGLDEVQEVSNNALEYFKNEEN